MKIRLYFSTIDNCRSTRLFKSLKGAQKAAWDRVGRHPEIGSNYAVSGDGIAKVVVSGDATLAQLFPPAPDEFKLVAGRTIHRNGKPFIAITRCGDTDAFEADEAAREIAAKVYNCDYDGLIVKCPDCDPVKGCKNPGNPTGWCVAR